PIRGRGRPRVRRVRPASSSVQQRIPTDVGGTQGGGARTMTKEHFNTIAAILASERADQDMRGQDLIDLLAGRLAAAFTTFDPAPVLDAVYLAEAECDRWRRVSVELLVPLLQRAESLLAELPSTRDAPARADIGAAIAKVRGGTP